MKDDIKLPPLAGTLASLPERHKKVIEAYGQACARAAIEADRQQRGEPEYRISACYFPKVGEVELSWERQYDGAEAHLTFKATPDQGKRLVSVIDPCVYYTAAPQPARQRRSEPVTGGNVSELLSAIQLFGRRKRQEGAGLSDPKLQAVRSAWDEVYRLVQAVAAPQPAEPIGDKEWKLGNLLTINLDGYPALGSFFVQIWEGDFVVARVYGNSEEEVRSRANALLTQQEIQE